MPTGPWARDLGLPWQGDGCKQWTRNPPELAYGAPLPTVEGVWAAGIGSAGGSVLMRKGPNGWRMDATRQDVNGNVGGLLGNDSLVVLFVGGGAQLQVHVRRNGLWADVTDPSAPVQNRGIVSGQALVALGTNAGEVRVYDGAWSALPAGTWATARALWGSPGDLYVAHATGLQHFDGTTWKELAPAFPQVDVVGVGGTAPTDVYAATATTVYQVANGTMTAIPGAPASDCNNQPPHYAGIVSAGAHVYLAGDCSASGYVTRLWKRSGGAWTALPPLPSAAYLDQVRALPDGTLTLGQTIFIGGDMYAFNGSAWTPYPVETPAPVDGLFTVAGGDTIYAVGAGVSRLAGSAWQPIGGVPAAVAASLYTAAWAAPDGKLFLAVMNAQHNIELWRYDGAAWTLDKTVNLPSGSGVGWSLYGRSSSDVLLVSSTGLYRWDGATWTKMVLPVPVNTPILGAAYAGSSGIVAAYQQTSGFGPETLLEFDGTTWTQTGTTMGKCCTQIGTPAAPAALVDLGNGSYAIRDLAGWTMKTTMLPGSGTMIAIAGPAPDKLIGRFSSGTMGYGLATLAGSTWTATYDPWLFFPTADPVHSLWTDGHTIALADRVGGHLLGGFGVTGGDAVTVCPGGP